MQQKLIDWYEANKRDLPWRKSTNPYIIWLSEIILQQTRVLQGLPYFYKFTQTYKTVTEFANANLDDILKIWQGLGYYSRARNMHKTAQIIRDEHQGKFPKTYQELLKLKGIGPYTAAAISSFAFNEKQAVVDGNVNRVIARFAGIYTPINSTAGKKEFDLLAQKLLTKNNPATHNQAMMELGALVCKPQNPDCHICPIQNACFAFQNNEQNNLPVKIKKSKPKPRYFNYIIFEYKTKTYISQRAEGDIWQGLYEFPLLEKEIEQTEFSVQHELKNLNYIQTENIQNVFFLESYKHLLTHQTIYANFWKIVCKTKPNLSNNMIEIEITDIKKYPVSRLLEKLITNNKLQHQIF